MRLRRHCPFGPPWTAYVEGCMVLHLSGRLRIYSEGDSSTDSFDRAQSRDCELGHKFGPESFRDHDRHTARGHETGNLL